MRTLLGVAVAIALLTSGCGQSSASDDFTISPKAQSVLTSYWQHKGNYTTKGYMKATCKDLRNGDAPAADAMALMDAEHGMTVTDAESLVRAAVMDVCPKAAKIPSAWR